MVLGKKRKAFFSPHIMVGKRSGPKRKGKKNDGNLTKKKILRGLQMNFNDIARRLQTDESSGAAS